MIVEPNVSIRLVTDPNWIVKNEKKWNNMIKKCSLNPFFLSGFITQFMEHTPSTGWSPLVLVLSNDKTIIGLVPLIMKRTFGIISVKFLFKPGFSPDFIVYEQYREMCIAYTIDYFFKTMRFQFADFSMLAESPNLQVLLQKCRDNRIKYHTTPQMGHSIIPIRHTWEEFIKIRGSKFRKEIRYIEGYLSRAGSWRIVCIEGENNRLDVLNKILYVERMSWKGKWRTRKGINDDIDLLMIWNGLHFSAEKVQNIKRNIWFLELNGKTIAYLFVILYKKTAYFAKTSYDERYKKYSPGKYIMNAAIHELFNSRLVKKIDFLTALPFMRTWTSTCLPRVRVNLSRKGIMPTILKILILARAKIQTVTLNITNTYK